MKKLLVVVSLASPLGLIASDVSSQMKPQVRIQTSKGAMVIELRSDAAPKSVENFLAYVDSGFYDGTVFHRVIKGFMIQGGGMTEDLRPKRTRPPIASEAKNGLKNQAGTVSMARTTDPDSATSQFFINAVDNEFLDYPGRDGFGYTVFGKVVQGMDIVQAIANVKTGPQDIPIEPVLIKSVVRIGK